MNEGMPWRPGAGLVSGTLTGVAVAVLCAALIAAGQAGLDAKTAAASLGAGFLTGIAAGWRSRDRNSPAFTPWDWLLVSIWALASIRAFMWVLYSVGGEWRVLSPHNLGDISLHIHLIRYFAGGASFWPESPILSGVQLTYPPGADLFNSLLLLAGIPAERGLVWAGLAGAAMCGWALWRWGGAFAMAAFLFNGGLAGFAFFQSGSIDDFQSAEAWKNVFLTMLIPQRGLLFAIPCGLLLLMSWRDEYFRSGTGIPVILRWLLYSVMPLFNLHAFIFLSLSLACFFLFASGSRAKVLFFTLSTVVPASIAVFLVTDGLGAAGGLHWNPGWMQEQGGAMFWFWNFGISLPLGILLIWQGLVRGDAEARAFTLLSIGVFILCSLVSFATWEWDNTKLILWAWIAAAPYVWSRVIFPWPALARAAVCVTLFFSGAVSLAGGLDGRHGYKLIDRSELDQMRKLLSNVPQGSRLAVHPEYNHPAILLGYPVVCGYEGHLWSHGLDYKETLKTLNEVLEKSPGWLEKASHIKAAWIVFPGATPLIIEVPPANAEN
jgi:hypothetical protein